MSEQAASKVASFTDGFTRLSKLGVAILGGFYLMSLTFPTAINYVALVPGKTIPCVWNLLTASFVETSLLMLLIDSLALLFLAKYLEPVWGSKEFLKFILVVASMVGLFTFSFRMIVYAFTQSEAYLYGQICGFHGVIAGFLVAVKQLMPESDIKVLGFVKLKVKNVPGLLVVAVLLLSGLSGVDVATFPIFGTYVAWVYLRHFQEKTTQAGVPGDLSEAFALASFFPALAKPAVDRVEVALGRVLCASRYPATYSVSSAPLPGSDVSDSVRRRERGARALEERLAAMAAGGSNADPEAGQNEEK